MLSEAGSIIPQVSDLTDEGLNFTPLDSKEN